MALPPPPLNVQPLGLLDAFAIKNGGQYPQTLDNRLQVNMDLKQWYGETNGLDYSLTFTQLSATTAWSIVTSPASAPAELPTSAGAVTVPSNEVWEILNWSFYWAFNAAAGSSLVAPLQLAVICPSVLTMIRQVPQTAFGGLVSAVAGQVGGSGAMIGTTFLKPGDKPALMIPFFTFAAGAELVHRCEIRLRRFRI